MRMGNLRGLLGITRMDWLPSVWIRELCGVTKGVDGRIHKGVIRLFGHVERMEKERIAQNVCVGVCVGSRSLGGLRKSWIDTVKIV